MLLLGPSNVVARGLIVPPALKTLNISASRAFNTCQLLIPKGLYNSYTVQLFFIYNAVYIEKAGCIPTGYTVIAQCNVTAIALWPLIAHTQSAERS